jgi:MoxR-like ATPase
VLVDEKIERYILSIVKSTREREEVLLGASPRASLNLYRASQGRAVLCGRDYVIPDDVQRIARNVLGHRLILNQESAMDWVSVDHVVKQILETVEVS